MHTPFFPSLDEPLMINSDLRMRLKLILPKYMVQNKLQQLDLQPRDADDIFKEHCNSS